MSSFVEADIRELISQVRQMQVAKAKSADTLADELTRLERLLLDQEIDLSHTLQPLEKIQHAIENLNKPSNEAEALNCIEKAIRNIRLEGLLGKNI